MANDVVVPSARQVTQVSSGAVISAAQRAILDTSNQSASELSRSLALKLRDETERISRSFAAERARLTDDSNRLDTMTATYGRQLREIHNAAVAPNSKEPVSLPAKSQELAQELASLPLLKRVELCISKIDDLERTNKQSKASIDVAFGPGNKWFWIIPVIAFMSGAGGANRWGIGLLLAIGVLIAEFAVVQSFKSTKSASIESNESDKLWLANQGLDALSEFRALGTGDLKAEIEDMIATHQRKMKAVQLSTISTWHKENQTFNFMPLDQLVVSGELQQQVGGGFRLGSYVASASPLGGSPDAGVAIDAVVPFAITHSLVLISRDENERRLAVDTVNAYCERLCIQSTPGELEFLLTDPLGRGGNLAGLAVLSEYEPKVISGKIWTEERNIDDQLRDVIQQIEDILQNVLGAQFSDFNEYNSTAGALKIARKVLVLLDLPNGLSEESSGRLRSILAHGPKCGVFCLLTCDLNTTPKWERASRVATAAEAGQESDWLSQLLGLPNIQAMVVEGTYLECLTESKAENDSAEIPRLKIRPDSRLEPKDSEVAFRRFGKAVKDLPTRAVVMPEASINWTLTSADGLNVDIGEVSSKKLQEFKFDEVLMGHALIAGVAGSGKSNLLHVLITNLAMQYSPQDLALYLVDFKQGVEFKRYADYRLPHAKVVAIQSEREFGLSILRSLYKEVERRGRLFKEANVQNLSSYRKQIKAPLERAVLIMDEYQVLVGGEDKIAAEARQIFDVLARQGRAMGIHLILASQSVTQGQLEEATRAQMGIRIALRLSETDARRIFADDNNKAVYLKRAGEAIYNNANGREDGNSRFQVFAMADDSQQRLLSLIQKKAESVGHKGKPVVFDGSTSCSMTDASFFTDPAPKENRLLLALGEPTTLDGPVTIRLMRQRQQNVLFAGTNVELVRDLFSSALISVAKSLASLEGSVFVDFSPPDDPENLHYEDLCAAVGKQLRYASRRGIGQVVDAFYAETKTRIDEEKGRQPARVFFVNRLQSARDLEYDEYANADGDLSTAQKFAYILRNGSEFGMHVVASSDSPERAFKVVSRNLQREFGLRVGTQMSEESSRTLFGDATGQRIGPNRAVLFDDELDRRELIRPYKIPSMDWIRQSVTSWR